MRRRVVFRAEVFQEGELYVSLCPELGVSSFGEDVPTAQRSLQEAVEAFLEGCESLDTLDEVLEESGFVLEDGNWIQSGQILRVIGGS